ANPTVSPSDTAICEGDYATLRASGESGATFNWYSVSSGGTATYMGTTHMVNPTTTTIYYVSQTVSGTESGRAAATVAVNPLPNAPIANNETVCYDGDTHTASANVGNDETVVWYTEASGGSITSAPSRSSVGTDNAYAAAKNNTTNCESATRTLVSLNINALPNAPTANNDTVCYDGSTHTASANVGNGETVVWYTAASGGNITSAPSRSSVGTTTAYAAAKNNTTNCESATRTLVNITINSLPNAPIANNDTVCYDGNTHTASANVGNDETVVWYTAASGGSITSAPSRSSVGTDNAYAAAKNNTTNCESATRTLVSITINALPNAPTVNPQTTSICYGETTTFALSGGLTYNWYTEPSGGIPFTSTGASYTTPILSVGTHTYYVSAVNGCESATRRVVTVTVNPIPSAPFVSPADTVMCPGTSITLRVSGTSGATFNWYNSTSGGTSLHTGTNYSVSPAAGLIKYYVSQKVNGCESADRDSSTVDVRVHDIPKSVYGSYCNGDAGYDYLGIIYTEGTWFNINVPGTTACDTSVTLYVTKNPTYDINVYDTICYGDKYQFNGNEYDTAGIYTITLPTIHDCDSIVSLNLSMREGCKSQIITVINDFYELTYGDAPFTFNVTASSGLPVTIEVSGTSADIHNVSAGTYLVTVQSVGTTIVTIKQAGDNSWASSEITITILVNPAQLIIIADDYTVTLGDPYPAFTYSYSGFVYGENESVIITPPVLYCSVANTNTVGEFPIIASGAEAANYEIEYQDGILKVKGPTGSLPNAFTPYNQDGFNDTFGAGYELQIFNRWGACFYNGTDGWDGRYKGKLVAPGVYYYHAKDADGDEYRGSVMLVKPL
ncbi:MAG: gliding motility-associated C-terminal domain-containing protein, partial [Prevotellaceae bacterium]|nr:gliding motility-associated C-terminal domain-containing protein [Prevotellaceae bacterium]